MAPQSATSSSTRSTAAAVEPGWGVTAHGRPSKSESVAPSGPDCSPPAIGWLPT